MILVIDNYDSFVHNLARYLGELVETPIELVRNDQLPTTCSADAVIISPGPCGPQQAGQATQFVQDHFQSIPMLGICLGHQIIIESLGGSIIQHPTPQHGKASSVYHSQTPLFEDVPSPFTAGRYHSLVAEPSNVPASMHATARTQDGTIMAVEHRSLPVYGLQFHPESILTQHGYQIVYNFCGWRS